jgi:phosphoglycerate dehydrogenase-like enzyme
MQQQRVLYLSHGPEDVYRLIRAELPDCVELVTLERDDDAERIARIADCAICIVAANKLKRAMIDAAPLLRLVQHQGVGYHDTVDLAALKARGIALAVTPEATATGVAEHTVMLMLAAAKHLPFVDSELRQGRWHVNTVRMRSRQLASCTIGYVGMGRIGRAVAERLRAFGCAGLYCDPSGLPAPDEQALALRRADLAAVLGEADIVTLHMPLTPETHHLIDAEALARMKRGAVLINTARGGLIDEAALCDALDSGWIGAAGLDVFETEPPPADHRLLGYANVVVTPHISAGTRDALREKMQAIGANLRRWCAGETLRNRIELN